MIKTIIIIAILVIILGLAAFYVINAKRKGRRCIGCAGCKECEGKCRRQ